MGGKTKPIIIKWVSKKSISIIIRWVKNTRLKYNGMASTYKPKKITNKVLRNSRLLLNFRIKRTKYLLINIPDIHILLHICVLYHKNVKIISNFLTYSFVSSSFHGDTSLIQLPYLFISLLLPLLFSSHLIQHQKSFFSFMQLWNYS